MLFINIGNMKELACAIEEKENCTRSVENLSEELMQKRIMSMMLKPIVKNQDSGYHCNCYVTFQYRSQVEKHAYETANHFRNAIEDIIALNTFKC